MPAVPTCLEKRYRTLDALIEELSARRFARNSEPSSSRSTDNAGIKLMCDFWNILKDDPDCNLERAVQERMGVDVTSTHSSFGPHRITCYMADRSVQDNNDPKKEAMNKVRNACCNKSDSQDPGPKASQKSSCCAKPVTLNDGSDVLPLSKVLCSLKDAASFDKKCSERITDLTEAQKRLQEQIQHLEHREKEGIKLLKQADCMWSCMEDTYKKKLAESLERQKGLLNELKVAEADVTKWRKNKKDLEFQMDNINKCHQEIMERTNQKQNDIKCMNNEIQDFKRRIASGDKDKDAASKSMSTKKQASDKIVKGINDEIRRTLSILEEEKKHKSQKEQEGTKYIKEAREDLQKICRVLLQKKLENEDLKAEREALTLEIEMLRQTCDQCQDKCKNKQISINDEILKVEKEIADFKVKCIRCHECVDTADVRKYCTDCPRCLQDRDCIINESQCSPDPTNECVCMSVKQKFMDNVFENMYTVLARQVNTCQGKCLAESIMKCLKRSRNGKVDEETKKILQEFILCVVRKNLNLTIIGGAVKTRCEMDPETYKQLLLCLKQVKVSRPPKVDKGTIAKKDPCRRWGGTSECNCPGGPKTCICTKKAPPPPKDPTPCPEDPEDKEENAKKEKIICPHKENISCGTECGMRDLDSLVGTEVASWAPDPCREKTCPFSKNMRAAQCVLGPERLSNLGTTKPRIPNLLSAKQDFKEDQKRTDVESHPRDRIIEEVMGRYTEVTPIEKVTMKRNQGKVNRLERRNIAEGDKYCKIKKSNSSKTFKDLTFAPVFIKNNKFSLEVSSKTKPIYISKKPNCLWTSDETLVVSLSRSSNDINLNNPSKAMFAVISNDSTEKCEREYSCLKTFPKNNSCDVCVETNIDKSDISLFRRTKCKNVKKIIKDLIKFDLTARDENYPSSVELMRVESLLKRLASQNRLNENNIKGEEVLIKNKTEVSNIVLENAFRKTENKQDIIKKISGTKTVLDEKKQIDEKDALLKKLYDSELTNTASCSCETTSPLATWKMSILDDDGEIVDYSTDLINTPSGDLGIELDDRFYNLLVKKFHTNPNSSLGILKVDNTGNYTLDFNPKKVLSNDLKIKMKKSPMGTMSIILNKSFIEYIKSGGMKADINFTIDKSAAIEVKKRTESAIATYENETLKSIIKTKSNNDYTKRLVEMYAEGKIHTTLKIIDDHECIEYEKARMLMTPSRNIALEIKTTKIIDENVKQEEDIGIFYMSYSDNFLLDFRQNNVNFPQNTIIRKGLNNTLLIIKKAPFVSKPSYMNNSKDYFELKVKETNNTIFRSPAVLKVTSSENYLVIVDKEFEHRCKEMIKHCTENETVGSVIMSKTLSDHYLISLNDKEESGSSCNAYLIKTSSGNIKVVVGGPTFDAIKRSLLRKQSNSSITFSKLLKFLKTYHLHNQKSRFTKQKQSNIKIKKCNSDSSIFNKSRIKNHECSITESGSLKKTNSGRYAFVLDKESKKLFVNNLGSYLKRNSNSLIPIKKTDSGGITINLNKHENMESQHGSLKVSPSGNVYVIIDENNLNKDNNAKTVQAAMSKINVRPVQNQSNKAVSTSCGANPLDSCCNFSKCFCEELQNTKSDWHLSENDNTNYTEYVTKQKCVTICDNNMCTRKYNSGSKKVETCSNISSPHIVIKPYDDEHSQRVKLVSKATAKNRREQCFYVVDFECPFHKDRYDSVSNELLEISGLCNTGIEPVQIAANQKFTKAKPLNTNNPTSIKNHEYSYLENMPPQLPPFLRNFTFS